MFCFSHDAAANNNNNFFYIKIRKMETKLNMMVTGPGTLWKTHMCMLAKSLGLSELIYNVSMLSVPAYPASELHLSWISRLLNSTHDMWMTIPN